MISFCVHIKNNKSYLTAEYDGVIRSERIFRDSNLEALREKLLQKVKNAHWLEVGMYEEAEYWYNLDHQ